MIHCEIRSEQHTTNWAYRHTLQRVKKKLEHGQSRAAPQHLKPQASFIPTLKEVLSSPYSQIHKKECPHMKDPGVKRLALMILLRVVGIRVRRKRVFGDWKVETTSCKRVMYYCSSSTSNISSIHFCHAVFAILSKTVVSENCRLIMNIDCNPLIKGI